MSSGDVPRGLQRLARLLIRGSHAPHLLGDLDELYQRDLARGHSRWSAGRRYVRNAVASAVRIHGLGHRRRLHPALVSTLDVKLALRVLAKNPLLTGVAALALGLGIPAALAPTHVWHAFMAPLPFEDGARIVGIRTWDPRTARPGRTSYQDFEHWRDGLTTFEEIGATRRAPWNVQFADGRAEPVRGAEISASTFEVLRVPPALGRTFQESDELPGGANVVVIGADLWASHFAGTADVIGSMIRLAGIPHTVVGVMPQGFSYPRDEVLWLPLRGEGANGLQVVGRLADGHSLATARSEVLALGLRADDGPSGAGPQLRPEVVTAAVQRAELPADGATDPLVYAAQLLAIVLLLVVCGNVGVTITARTSARSGEIAVRGALGASRARIVGQLFVEGLVLALSATVVGLLVGSWAIERLESLKGPELTMVDSGMTWRTVGLAVCLAVLCAGASSLIPALKATRGGIQGRLNALGGRSTGMRFGAGSTTLIVAELALSVGLLSYGLAWTHTVLQDTAGDLGIELDRYLAAQVLFFDPVHGADVAAYSDELARRVEDFQVELKRRLEAEPGVRAVAMASAGDLPGSRNAPRLVEVEEASGGPAVVAWERVDVDFFRDLERPVLQGRDFTRADLPAERGAHRAPVIVNTTFVEQVLGGRNPIGRRLRYLSGAAASDAWHEIVGVVGPLGLNPVNPGLDAGVYHPAAPGELNAVGFVIDAADDPTALIPRVRRITAEVEPAAMVQRAMLLSDLAEREWIGLRYLALGPVLISLVAMLLSAAGLYAVMAFSVSQRTRELGIRAALGASRASIVATIGRKAAFQLGLGALLGCALATSVMYSLTEDPLIEPQNPALLVLGVTAGLIALGLLACAAPALRAVRIQPTEALRDG